MNACNVDDDMSGFKVLNTKGVTATSPLKESRPKIQNLGLSNRKGNVSHKHIIKQRSGFYITSFEKTSYNLQRKIAT